jgi:hypothetical protein
LFFHALDQEEDFSKEGASYKYGEASMLPKELKKGHGHTQKRGPKGKI